MDIQGINYNINQVLLCFSCILQLFIFSYSILYDLASVTQILAAKISFFPRPVKKVFQEGETILYNLLIKFIHGFQWRNEQRMPDYNKHAKSENAVRTNERGCNISFLTFQPKTIYAIERVIDVKDIQTFDICLSRYLFIVRSFIPSRSQYKRLINISGWLASRHVCVR